MVLPVVVAGDAHEPALGQTVQGAHSGALLVADGDRREMLRVDAEVNDADLVRGEPDLLYEIALRERADRDDVSGRGIGEAQLQVLTRPRPLAAEGTVAPPGVDQRHDVVRGRHDRTARQERGDGGHGRVEQVDAPEPEQRTEQNRRCHSWRAGEMTGSSRWARSSATSAGSGFSLDERLA